MPVSRSRQTAPRTVQVRVLRSTQSHTTVSTLEIPQKHWTLVTSRLPALWPAGTEVTITFTPMELEYLQGKGAGALALSHLDIQNGLTSASIQ